MNKYSRKMNKNKLTLNCERSETVKHKMAEELICVFDFASKKGACVGCLWFLFF